MSEIYLDNSATTVVCREAAEKVMEIMTQKYGNPSSLHSKGTEAYRELEYARETIAQSLGAAPQEIYFTSGGTEGNNTAVFGTAYARRKRGNRIVTTAIEHSSIIESVRRLENEGFEVIRLEPDSSGVVPLSAFKAAINDKTILVSVMAVNNEIGSIQPFEKIRRLIDDVKAPALYHIDAVQAYGKIPVKAKKTGADMITVSSHKVHGPKGVGGFYLKKGVHIQSLHCGGEQEHKVRPGTEALPLICGFAEAVRCLPDMNEAYHYMQALNRYARQCLSALPEITINSAESCLPYILNISTGCIKSETMLHFLEQNQIYVSSGSACARGKKSHVLTALHLDQNQTDSALRISFSRYNKKEDVEQLTAVLKQGLERLVRFSE